MQFDRQFIELGATFMVQSNIYRIAINRPSVKKTSLILNKIKMKNYQKIAVALMVGASAIGFSAFTTNLNRATESWHFKNGRPLSDARVPGAYELSTGVGCNDIPGKPCIIQFNNANPSTPNLASYLATFSTDAAVANAAVNKRNN